MSMWVYMLGETTGGDIKIGHSKDDTVSADDSAEGTTGD